MVGSSFLGKGEDRPVIVNHGNLAANISDKERKVIRQISLKERAVLDRLPTQVNLLRRGVQLASTSCPICGNVEETGKLH
ncbi:hypothetical protein Tco_0175021 [Tanacetum coccineum]